MRNDLSTIQKSLQNLFKKHVPPLQIRKDNSSVYEVAGTIEVMQGKQKVEGYYFGSVVPKPNDIRLYYFPIYTHPQAFDFISADLRKCLNGKNCFHIKKLDGMLENEIDHMIAKGVELYLFDKLI